MGDSGQIISSAAEVYDEFFLPALFEAWPPRLMGSARIEPGMRVVDVACGTGVLAIEAAKATQVYPKVSPEGYPRKWAEIPLFTVSCTYETT